MDFAKGIPGEYRTLVVVPMMLLSPRAVKAEVDRLETRYLANNDPNLRFSLFADYTDAPTQETPDDENLLRLAREGIEGLNGKYGADRFLLFHRERRWSASERRWIGWERKRGKLEELNRLLNEENPLSAADLLHVGSPEAICGIGFVITLDSDTQLPSGSARRMVETMAHPLNQAQLGPDGRTVAAGYTIIQPRVCTSLPSATASHFAQLFSDPTGMDPYCHAVSDVYQDLTGEGTFYGKGIYDARVFHRVLARRFPEATILSHDLLEGAFVRVGLATEIELLDLFPPSYQVYAKRQHRWTRGDWQIADWVMPRVGNGPNPLSIMNRWKILDNLRRSLVPTASLVLLIAGWASETPAVWSIIVALSFFFPALLQFVSQPLSVFRGKGFAWRDIGASILRGLLATAILPHQAWLTGDAIVRVWYRRLISRRRLLEWETAQMTQMRWRSGAHDWVFLTQVTLISIFVAAVAVVFLRGPSLPPAVPFLSLWVLAPSLTWWLNGGRRRQDAPALAPKDRRMLRQVARLTWRYFDDFVNEKSNWLPPDNYQEALNVEVAQRTSPTNIGMWLLSALAAYDFGYLTLEQLITRLSSTATSIAQMEFYEGHLLNWYDTQSIEPLRPKYISTVDSGNLLASFWAFLQGCRRAVTEPLFDTKSLLGMADAAAIMEGLPPPGLPRGQGRDNLSALGRLFLDPPERLDDLVKRIRSAVEPARAVAEAYRPIEQTDREGSYWADQIAQSMAAWTDTVTCYLPWVEVLTARSEQQLAPLGPKALAARRKALSVSPSLRSLAEAKDPVTEMLHITRGSRDEMPGDLAAWLDEVERALACARDAAVALLIRAEALIDRIERLSRGMNMRFLYDPERRLFAVGYNVTDHRLDSSYYDLLASEARLASFVAIARGDIPAEHWTALGRPFGIVGRRPALLSWNGTMFEYLMPLLLSRTFAHSLLDLACREAVAFQIAYGAKRGIPWGVSEAAFSGLDSHQIYQYRAFGVPWLGLKRGLEEDLVVAPYATALALALDRRPPRPISGVWRAWDFVADTVITKRSIIRGSAAPKASGA